MSMFAASNGMRVWRPAEGQGAVQINGVFPDATTISALDAEALAEFFRAEEDDRLGRWRWPDNPDYVVYPQHSEGGGRPDSFRVFKESTGNTWSYDLEHLRDTEGEPWDAARAYFDAHPQRKPWEDAKPGDVWAFEVEGEEMFAAFAIEGFLSVDFVTPTGKPVNLRSSVLTSARRIWPEEKA
ncbi:hypothetical protein [Microbacterium sp. KNMS]